MSGWFYASAGRRHGPVEVEALLGALFGFDDPRDVPIWHESLSRWTRAADVPELARRLPPPIPVSGTAVPSPGSVPRVEEAALRPLTPSEIPASDSQNGELVAGPRGCDSGALRRAEGTPEQLLDSLKRSLGNAARSADAHGVASRQASVGVPGRRHRYVGFCDNCGYLAPLLHHGASGSYCSGLCLDVATGKRRFCTSCLAQSLPDTVGNLQTVNGVGSTLIGRHDPCPACGSFVARAVWVLPFIRRKGHWYRILYLSPPRFYRSGYQFLSRRLKDEAATALGL
jgi:hypothetical protein